MAQTISPITLQPFEQLRPPGELPPIAQGTTTDPYEGVWQELQRMHEAMQPPLERNVVGEALSGIDRGAFIRAPQTVGKAMEAFGLQRAGRAIGGIGTAIEEAGYFAPSAAAGQPGVRRTVATAFESIGQTAAITGTVGLPALIASVATGGTLPAVLAFTAVTPLVFGAAEYQQFGDEMKALGIPDDWVPKLLSAAAEAGFEGVGNVIDVLALRSGFTKGAIASLKQPLRDAIKRIAGPQLLDTAKRMAVPMVGEAVTEGLTAEAQTGLRQGAGIPAQGQTGEAMLAGGLAGLVFGALGGSAAHVTGRVRANALRQIGDPNAPVEARTAALNSIMVAMEQAPEGAIDQDIPPLFRQYAEQAIAQRQKIPLEQSIHQIISGVRPARPEPGFEQPASTLSVQTTMNPPRDAEELAPTGEPPIVPTSTYGGIAPARPTPSPPMGTQAEEAGRAAAPVTPPALAPTAGEQVLRSDDGRLGKVIVSATGGAIFQEITNPRTVRSYAGRGDVTLPADHFNELFPARAEGMAPEALAANRAQFLRDEGFGQRTLAQPVEQPQMAPGLPPWLAPRRRPPTQPMAPMGETARQVVQPQRVEAPVTPVVEPPAPPIAEPVAPEVPQAVAAGPTPAVEAAPPLLPEAPPAATPAPSVEPVVPAEPELVVAPAAPAEVTPPEAVPETLTAPTPILEAPVTPSQPTAPPSLPHALGFAVDVFEAPLDRIHRDPERYQYKIFHGAKGETGTLAGAKRYDRTRSGPLDVWWNPETQQIDLINGHNRFDLAERSGEKSLPVQFINAATPEEARGIGALKNIGEGNGTAIDAAKFFRDAGFTAEDLAELNLPMTAAKIRDGLALANLNPTLFGAVVREEFPIERAVIIGMILPEAPQQFALMRELDLSIRRGKTLTNPGVKELAEAIRDTPTRTVQEETLFGTEERTVSLAPERASLSAGIRGDLSTDKELFGRVARAKTAEKLARGGNVIDIQRSQAISKDAAQILDIFDQLKNRGGPISDALNAGAQRLAGGDSLATVQRDTFARIRADLPAIIGRTAEERGTGGEPSLDLGAAEATPGQAPTEAPPAVPGAAQSEVSSQVPAVTAAERPAPEGYATRLAQAKSLSNARILEAAERSSTVGSTPNNAVDLGLAQSVFHTVMRERMGLQGTPIGSFTDMVARFREYVARNPGQEQQFATGAQSTRADLTLDDFKAVFGPDVTQLPTGGYHVTLPRGRYVDINYVERVTMGEEERIAFEVGYQEPWSGERMIAGRIRGTTIDLVRGAADRITLRHEVTHFLENSGLLTREEVRALNQGAASALGKDSVSTEERAQWVAETLNGREYRADTPLGRALDKVWDFLDKLLGLVGIQTTRGVLRSIETGAVFGREGTPADQATQQFQAQPAAPPRPEATGQVAQENKLYTEYVGFLNMSNPEVTQLFESNAVPFRKFVLPDKEIERNAEALREQWKADPAKETAVLAMAKAGGQLNSVESEALRSVGMNILEVLGQKARSGELTTARFRELQEHLTGPTSLLAAIEYDVSDAARKLRRQQFRPPEVQFTERLKALADQRTMSDEEWLAWTKRFSEVLSKGDAALTQEFLDHVKDPTLWQYFQEWRYGSMLSGISTNVANAGGNVFWGFFNQGILRGLEGLTDHLLVSKYQQRDQQRFVSEVWPAITGLAKGYRLERLKAIPAFMRGGRAAIESLPGFQGLPGLSKFEREMGHYSEAWANARWRLDFPTLQKLGMTEEQATQARAYLKDHLGIEPGQPIQFMRTLAPWVTLASRAMTAVDFVAKAAVYDSEMAALAERGARLDGQAGTMQGMSHEDRRAWYQANPTDEMHTAALKRAHLLTFTDAPSGVAQWLMRGRNVPYLGKPLHFLVPFLATPDRLIVRALELVPLLGLIPMREASFTGQFKGENLAPLLARQMAGGALAAMAIGAYAAGTLTGAPPEPPNEREAFYRQGKQAYAMRMGEQTWLSYRRFEPLNLALGIVPIMGEAIRRYMDKGEESNALALFTYLSMTLTQHILEGSYFAGISPLFQHASPTGRQGSLLGRQIDALVPYAGFRRNISQAMDAATTAEGNILRHPSAWYEHIAGVEQIVPVKVRYNAWGQPITMPGSVATSFLPYKVSTATSDPVEQELARLKIFPGPPSQTDRQGVKLPQADFDRLVQEGGAKAKANLDRVVRSPSFQMMPDATRERWLRKAIRDARDDARTDVERSQRRAGRLPLALTGVRRLTRPRLADDR